MRSVLFYLIPLMLCILSCKEDKPDTPNNSTLDTDSLQMYVLPEYNGLPFFLDSVYVSSLGDSIQFTELKFYLTRIGNGSQELIESALFDFRKSGSFVFTAKGSPGNFANISSRLGVDVTLNHSDPSLFPLTSPLNILNAVDMHWDWNPGYIFMKIEAKVDTISDGVSNFDHFLVYHIGMDANCSDVSWNNVNWQPVGSQRYNLQLGLDLYAFLNNPSSPINIRTESMTHSAAGQEDLTGKVITNFKYALQP